jgi:hypothetical protein
MGVNMYSNNEDRIKTIENSLEAVNETLRNVTGSPTIKGWGGARLDLNDNIDALKLNNILKRLEERVSALEKREG